MRRPNNEMQRTKHDQDGASPLISVLCHAALSNGYHAIVSDAMTRRKRARKPPPALLQQRVLAYAVLPRSVPFLGDNSIFIGSPG